MVYLNIMLKTTLTKIIFKNFIKHYFKFESYRIKNFAYQSIFNHF